MAKQIRLSNIEVAKWIIVLDHGGAIPFPSTGQQRKLHE
jgi:hypothetical protein